MIMRTKSSTYGFTLIELMVVTLFLAIIGTYTWSYLRSTMNTQKKIEQKTSIQQTGISILTKLQDDITQVFFVDSNQKLTFFKGRAHEISFSTLSHDAPSPQDRECEESDVFYTMDDDKEDPDGKTKMLLRKEIPYFESEADKDSQFEPVAVAHQILSLDFSYSADGQKYLDEWDANSADHPNQLPKLVKIKLVVQDSGDHEETFETLIDLPMTDDINTSVAAPPGQPGGQPGTNPSKTSTTPASPGTKPATSPVIGGPGGVK